MAKRSGRQRKTRSKEQRQRERLQKQRWKREAYWLSVERTLRERRRRRKARLKRLAKIVKPTLPGAHLFKKLAKTAGAVLAVEKPKPKRVLHERQRVREENPIARHCKERPNTTARTGSGPVRPFIPWCNRSK